MRFQCFAHNAKKQIFNCERTCINNAYPQAEIPVLQPRCCCVNKTVIIASQEESPHLGGHPWLHFFSLLAVFASSFVHTSPNSTAQVPRLELGSLWRKHVIKLQWWVGQLLEGRARLAVLYLIMSGGGTGGDAPAKSFVTRGGQTVFKNTLDSPFRLKWW